MSDNFEVFADREADYCAWVVANPGGFVLNANRKPRATYMVLHTASCHTVTQYRQYEGRDAFTGGTYIKVCSDVPGALLGWMAGYGAKNFTTLCSSCKPDVSSIDQVAVDAARLQAEARQLMAAPIKLQQELANIPNKPPSFYYAQTKIFKRNPAVVAAVLLRAKGVCERCQSGAPFLRSANQEPYLEVHHKVRLTDGGIDHPENALALCPNCHREAHFG
ncbi:MAG: HNH endonuclease signature motif containing protein [Polaromonas sp.]|nr:HNH endonuclease signature motif containing protein [Polaromonas sp.]